MSSNDDFFFDCCLSAIEETSKKILDAYSCDLKSTPNTKTAQEQQQQQHLQQQQQQQQQQILDKGVREFHARHMSMVQLSGITAYQKKRSHERMPSSGKNIRVPYNVRKFYDYEKPPPLTKKQQYEVKREDLNYVSDMIDKARKERIDAEAKEEAQNIISMRKLEYINAEAILLNKNNEQKKIKKRLKHLMKRNTSEEHDQDYTDREDEMFESWKRRNSVLFKQKSKNHPEKNDGSNGIIKRYNLSIRRKSSIVHLESAKNLMKNRMDNNINVHGILGIEEKKMSKTTKTDTVNSVFK
jgi:hypothetical protein